VTGLLVDADLFRRLRARGDARGADDGIRDYRAALRLVSGPPLSGLRPSRWSWLFEGDRLDFHLQHAVVDVVALLAIVSGEAHRRQPGAAGADHELPHSVRFIAHAMPILRRETLVIVVVPGEGDFRAGVGQ